MTTTDLRPIPAAAAGPRRLTRLPREITGVYTQALGEVDPFGPDTPDLDPGRVRSRLAQVADLPGEVCTDLLLLRYGADSADREYVQDARDAVGSVALRCRRAAAHVR